MTIREFVKLLFPSHKLSKHQTKVIEKIEVSCNSPYGGIKYRQFPEETLADQWLFALRDGRIEAPDVDGIIFDDGSHVEWDGRMWRRDA